MNAKTVLLAVLIALVIVAAVFGVAFATMPGFSYMLLGQPASQQQYGPGYSRGMMGGGYNQPVAPNNPPAGNAPSPANTPSAPSNNAPSAASTPVAPSNSAPSRGRGMMGSGGQPAGSLVAVTSDGKTIPATTKLPENTAAQTVGKMNVAIALTPYPPVSFQTGNFDLTLTDEKGQAITDAKIRLDLTMPGMWMPPSKPNAQNLGEGKYKASATWTMRGLWRIEVIIERGSEKSSAFFDVWL
ncbi:MAG: FixH family protein [Chloroflexi bacterium]|nr:FixH family protein [Chloroflexota bacterium]